MSEGTLSIGNSENLKGGELKSRLMRLLEHRKEVVSEFQDCRKGRDGEEAFDLAIDWWELCEKIDNLKKKW